MLVNFKTTTEGQYLEIDLTVKDIENIKLGRYPIETTMINGVGITVSVGFDHGAK